jgi:hypothetical protein
VQTYFLGLLGTATVLIGIAVAFLVAFVQISAGRFSAAVAALALNDWQVRLWLMGLALVFAALAGACLILSLPPPRPPLASLTRDQERVVVALAGLAAVLGGLGFVIGLATRAMSFNSAPRLAEGVVRAVRGRDLLTMIDEEEAVVRLRHRAMSAGWAQTLAAATEISRPADEAANSSALEETPTDGHGSGTESEFALDLSGGTREEPRKEDGRHARPSTPGYPLLPIIELLNEAVRDGDRVTVSRTLQAIREQWRSWLEAARDDVRRELVVDAIRENLMESLVELIDRHGVPSLFRLYLPELGLLAQSAYEIQPALLRGMLDHMTQTVVRLILRDEDVAAAAGVRALFALERRVGSDVEAAIAVHQALGSIGGTVGHLLPAPLGFAFDSGGFGYLDASRSNVLFALRDGYDELSRRAESVGNPVDARIWLEATEVTISSLLDRAVQSGDYASFREHVGDLAGDLFRAVETLTDRGADVCLSIGLLALKRFADIGIAADEKSLWEMIGAYALRLGMIAEDRGHEGFVGRSGAEDAVAIFQRVPERYRSSVMLDVYIHHPDGMQHETVWHFVKRAGVTLGTNFEMMFDPATGQDYSKDDPRRG